MNELIELERRGWEALSREGDAGKNFYASILRDEAVMLFPGGLRIEGRKHILQSLGVQPWSSFDIENPKVVRLTPVTATVVYKVTAQREGIDSYTALVSSTYVKSSDWKLVIHQQTQVE